jgi:hypothetical protein
VNQQPDIASERGNVPAYPDKIGVSVTDKTWQTRHTNPGAHGDQMLTDVVQFASHGAIACNAEQPLLLWHVAKFNSQPA